MNKLLCILKTILIEIKATAMLQGPNDKPGLPFVKKINAGILPGCFQVLLFILTRLKCSRTVGEEGKS